MNLVYEKTGVSLIVLEARCVNGYRIFHHG
jgi:hypothetical protein